MYLTRLKIAAAFSVLVFSDCTVAEPPSPSRAFVVADGIELTTIVEPPGANGFPGVPQFRTSPDGSKFFIVTRSGNIAGNYNEFQLLVFDVASVRKVLGSSVESLQVVEAARMRSTSNRPGISAVRWIDNRELAFIGEREGEEAQVYVADANGDRLERLTEHATSVVDFDINRTRDVIYAAIVPAGWSEEEKNGVVLDSEILWDLWQRNSGKSFYRQIAFYADGAAGERAVRMSPYTVRGGGSHGMWLAPDGRHAVALIHREQSPDAWWTDYEPVAENPYFAVAGAHSEFSSFTSEHREVFLQYVLIDLATGDMQPLVDAPAALYFGGMHLAAHWFDSRRVAIANTFLPLDDVADEERSRRKARPAVIELDIRDGQWSLISFLPTTGLGKGAVSGELIGSDLAPDGTLRVKRMDFSAGPGSVRTVVLKRAGRGWEEVESSDLQADVQSAAALPFELEIAQDLNTPPDLRATLNNNGTSRLLTDLNPDFRNLTLGKAEVFAWETADGRTVRGGLLLPPRYRDGKRYPLIIQTHGFNPGEFLVTGPGGSPSGFAARALANHDFVVLQVPDATPKGFRDELEGQTEVYRSAISKLAELEIIDPERVGMHGWSRTGLYVQHAITFSDLDLAAATVSDPSLLGVFYHVLSFGAGYPGMLEQERLIGAPLWGSENAQIWAERDPVLNLHRVRTPLRIETYGRTLGGWWDMYALLRRHQRPAEYVYFPEGQHVLTRPREQRTSQQGNVDWYRFWLKDETNASPSKAEQNSRWQRLRSEALAQEPGQ